MYVNQVKGEHFSAIKATANEDCLFNSSSILLHGNESLALHHAQVLKFKYR